MEDFGFDFDDVPEFLGEAQLAQPWSPPLEAFPIREILWEPVEPSHVYGWPMFDIFGNDDELQDAAPLAVPDDIPPPIPELSTSLPISQTQAPSVVRKMLDTWLELHADDPYLKDGDAEAIAHLTGLNVQQVRTYMNNARSRRFPKHGSGASLNSQASSSSLGPRKGRRRHRSSSSSIASLSRPAAPKDKIYQCTWCASGFRRKFDWKRHEESTHFPQEEWICMRFYPAEPNADGFSTCTFCGARLVGTHSEILLHSSTAPPIPVTKEDIESHLQEEHNMHPCFDRVVSERTFMRKDKLQQHLVQVHDVQRMTDMIATHWKRAVNRDVQMYCGFCWAKLNSWSERAEHVASHFENGLDVSAWHRGANEFVMTPV